MLQSKKCKDCNATELYKFSLKNTRRCRDCQRIESKKYVCNTPENTKHRLHKFREKHKDHDKLYYQQNKQKIKESHKIYFEKNKEKIIEKHRIKYHQNPQYHRDYKKKLYHSNKDKYCQFSKDYYNKNREKILDRSKRQTIFGQYYNDPYVVWLWDFKDFVYWEEPSPPEATSVEDAAAGNRSLRSLSQP